MYITNRDGMTLIEVIIALSLLIIVAVGAMATFSTLLTANRANTSTTELQAATQEVMEDLRAEPYANLASFNGASITRPDGITIGISVSEAEPNLLQIEVTGTRSGRTGGVFTLVTLRSSRTGG